MITPPHGWSSRPFDEDGLSLVPPDPARGILRYVEQQRPLRSTTELIRALGVPRGWREESRTAPERIVTTEGEYGALVCARGSVAGRRVGLTFGLVFLDDCYARLTGIAYGDDVPVFEELVRTLTTNDTHVLGRVRRRRFMYAIPDGWRATGGLYDARLFPPDHPRDPTRMHVSAALPNQPGLVDVTLGKLAAGRPISAPTLAANARLTGRRFEIGGGEITTHVVFLEDQQFVYPVRMDAPSGDDLAPLLCLTSSVEPIPGQTVSVPRAMALSHWVE